MGCIEDPAIRIDLQHIDSAICSHAEITARIAITVHCLEQTHRLRSKHFFNLRVVDGGDVHLLVLDPLHVVMLECLTFRENEFHRLERDGLVRVIGIFCNEAGELTPLDELFEKRAAEFLDFPFGLGFELFQIFAA
jgi:hypothetical protein